MASTKGQKNGAKASADEKEFTGTTPKILPLSSVRKNSWNPTSITAAERERIKHGLEVDGWILSQSLLVWGKDEKGVRRNVIIDGEQRHTVALELGRTRGPMVFLDGLTEAQAKALTIKMLARRAGGAGAFDMTKLAASIPSIRAELSGPNLALDLGLDAGFFRRLTEPPVREENRGRTRVAVTIECPHCHQSFQR